MYREVLQQRVAPHQYLLRGRILVDVVGLVQVKQTIQALLTFEDGAVDAALHEVGSDVFIPAVVLVSGARPPEPSSNACATSIFSRCLSELRLSLAKWFLVSTKPR